MSRTTIFYQGIPKAHIQYIAMDAIRSQRSQQFYVAGNLVKVVKFTFQSIFGNSRQNLRHPSARGRKESLELYFYPLIWLANIKTKGFTSRKSFCRSGSQTLISGGREASTGNTFAVRRLVDGRPNRENKLKQIHVDRDLVVPYRNIMLIPPFWTKKNFFVFVLFAYLSFSLELQHTTTTKVTLASKYPMKI